MHRTAQRIVSCPSLSPATFQQLTATDTEMNDSDTLSIQLTIGSKTYPLEIDRRYEEIYRRAAQLINEKIRRYINVFPDQEKEDYMAMALIDIAVSLTQETGIDDRVRDMIHTIDQVLQLDKK